MDHPKVIAFRGVHEPYGWLSNMSPHPVRYWNLSWKTTEALFQASRFSEPELREEIRTASSPMTAKALARKYSYSMTRIPRSAEDLAFMEFVLRLKIKQHPILEQTLRDTGNSKIIEDCTKRGNNSGRYWGAVLLPSGLWEGENMLGRLWMLVRMTMDPLPSSPAQ